ncbi:UvrB/uvrC motif family protein [Histomonas meleagridis]|uniref:UvrB/uvrC motif family protein n=1 Tax=Histomonas meleagridis TaxID=135588 RepID=UPI003559B3F7|nr:UvrB/uvrC motif family protein [Histomonas meleagridis]KAH0799579.1 UvrB/uvrC motif family protein [Histomonas meleagridis]
MAKIQNNPLEFTIPYVTSETEENPAFNLINSNPYSDGWISNPNSKMPQEIIFDFGSEALVTQIRFISHQTKIASNINIFFAKDAPNYRKAKFELIDSFQFSDNQQNNFKAREVQCAHLQSISVRYLKLQITSVYQNKFNKAEQVGLASVFVMGHFDKYEDSEISRLEQLKQEAIAREDYMTAYNLKSQIDNLQKNREIIRDLQRQKEEAIRKEQYRLAESIKRQIDRICNPDSINQPDFQSKDDHIRPSIIDNSPPPREAPSYNYFQEDSPPVQRRLPSIQEDSLDSHIIDDGYLPSDVSNARQRNEEQFPYVDDSKDVSDPDKRVIKPAPNGEYDFERFLDAPNPSEEKRKNANANSQNTYSVVEPDTIEEQSTYVESDILDPTQRKEAELFIEHFGPEFVIDFYSKNVNSRVSGIINLSNCIREAKGSLQQSLFVRFCHMLRHRLKEQVMKVFSTSLEELMSLADSIKFSGDTLRSAIEPHMNMILKRIGGRKDKTSMIIFKFAHWIIDNQYIGIDLLTEHLFQTTKPPIIWTNIEGRLRLIEELLESYGILEGNLDGNVIIPYVFNYLESPKSEVRTNCCRVLAILADNGYGRAIMKRLNSSSLPQATQTMVKKAISQES